MFHLLSIWFADGLPTTQYPVVAVPQPSCNTVTFSRCLDEIYNKLFFIRLEPSYICPYVIFQLFITARKRSLGQGNIFGSASHSVRGGGGSGRFSSREGLPRGGGGGSASRRACTGVCLQGGSTAPLPRNQKSWWYASYWNACLVTTLSVSHSVHGGDAHPQTDTP